MFDSTTVSEHDKTNKTNIAHSEDSDQPVLRPLLITVFAVLGP